MIRKWVMLHFFGVTYSDMLFVYLWALDFSLVSCLVFVLYLKIQILIIDQEFFKDMFGIFFKVF